MELEYCAGTRLLAVIGDPVSHSLSPLLQNAMLRELGLDYAYLAFQVPRDGLAAFVTAAETLNFAGFNMTMPHKETFLPLADALTAEAQAAQSVNTVRLQHGQRFGHSTDGIGFRRAMADQHVSFEGKTVTVLGAGGAARSIVRTAEVSGIRRLFVANRTRARAEQLCQGHEALIPETLDALPSLLPETDLLISTIPAGMAGTGGAAGICLEPLKPGAPVFDCIYAPPVTPVMAEAQRLGHPAFNGLGMLIYQAVYALGFFTEQTLSAAEVDRLGQCCYRALAGHAAL